MGSEVHGPVHTWRHSLLVMLLVGSVWALCLQTPAFWRINGIGQTSVPFLDLYGLLAAGEIAQTHGDPFQPNPLDPFHRPHVYTTWWLVSGTFGLTRADTQWVGLAMAAFTLVAAVALVRPRRTQEVIQFALVLCSPAVLMGVYRGNNDLVVLIVICAALGCLRSSSSSFHALGIILLAVAAALKYYPLAAVVVLLGLRKRREVLAALTLFVAVLVLAWPALKPGLASAARFKPQPDGLYAFGAPSLFRDFGLVSPIGWLILSVLTGGVVLWHTRSAWRAAPAAQPDSSAEREFICGAALLVGIFFLGASFVYKLIFAVWLLPELWRTPASPTEASWRRVTWWLLLALLWVDGVLAIVINLAIMPLSLPLAYRMVDVTMVVDQLLAWGLVMCLLRELVLYGIERLRWFRPKPRRESIPG